ncbi:hypothetical protein CH262_12525 [Rhodococcus sp. 05-2255-1e]|nr:hypothetical protein CH262_12525 [Rhodococcus sp. 05-2255-1e]
MIKKLREVIQGRRGLYGTLLDDFMADSMIHYAEQKQAHPDYSTSQLVNAIISKINNEFRDSNTKKNRQVDMEFVDETDFPETYTIEEQIEIDTWIQSQSHVWKKVIKEFSEWNESAPEGEPVPKKLRQRLKRLSKPEVHSHTQKLNAPRSGSVRGLRDSSEDYDFEVIVSQREPKIRKYMSKV